MKKHKILCTLSLPLVLSLFANIVLTINLVHRNNDSLTDQSNTKTSERFSDVSESNNEQAKICTENFFQIFYNYTNENYEERYEKIKKYISDKVFVQLTGGGKPTAPKIKISNKVADLRVFINQNNNGELDGFVVLKTTLSVDQNESPETSQMFQVHLVHKDNSYIIDKLESFGVVSKMEKS